MKHLHALALIIQAILLISAAQPDTGRQIPAKNANPVLRFAAAKVENIRKNIDYARGIPEKDISVLTGNPKITKRALMIQWQNELLFMESLAKTASASETKPEGSFTKLKLKVAEGAAKKFLLPEELQDIILYLKNHDNAFRQLLKTTGGVSIALATDKSAIVRPIQNIYLSAARAAFKTYGLDIVQDNAGLLLTQAIVKKPASGTNNHSYISNIGGNLTIKFAGEDRGYSISNVQIGFGPTENHSAMAGAELAGKTAALQGMLFLLKASAAR